MMHIGFCLWASILECRMDVMCASTIHGIQLSQCDVRPTDYSTLHPDLPKNPSCRNCRKVHPLQQRINTCTCVRSVCSLLNTINSLPLTISFYSGSHAIIVAAYNSLSDLLPSEANRLILFFGAQPARLKIAIVFKHGLYSSIGLVACVAAILARSSS